MPALSGGCACGRVRYECEEVSIVDLICHCRDCQRPSGSAYSSMSVVPTDKLTLTRELKYYAIKGDSGGTMQRGLLPGMRLTRSSPKIGNTGHYFFAGC